MSRSGQAFVAATEGTQYTLYAAMRRMGIPLSPEQEKFQSYLEAHYPEVVDQGANDTYAQVKAEDYGSGGDE